MEISVEWRDSSSKKTKKAFKVQKQFLCEEK